MKSIKPTVVLIVETSIMNDGLSDFLTTTSVSSRDICYTGFDESLDKNLAHARGNKDCGYIQESLIAVSHRGVLEHSSVGFTIANVSCVFNHELVHHRIGCAYS